MARARLLLLLAAMTIVGCTAAPKTAAPPLQAPSQPSEWDRVLAAAKEEGTVAIIGPTGDDRRTALTEGFEQSYGITVDYLADAGAGIPPRLSAERGAGQYRWDIFVGGTTTALESLIPMGALDPMEPALIRPEVKDPSSWRGGALEFVDEGRTCLVITPFHRGTLFVNPTLVKPEEFTSYKDLLDPKWRGKLASDDPRRAGPGQATFTFFYLHPDLGPDFIRALVKQDLTLLQDYQQEIDGVGQGRYPVLLGSSDALAEARIKQGVPITIVDPSTLREGSDVSPASGSVGLFNGAAHPNAARVYLDWLLSKDGQTAYARATGYISARLDVPTDHTFPWRVPRPGAVKTYDLRAMETKDAVLDLLREVLPQ
ncbi:MAG TPA: extracellular solute-binding protein [Chloroflexota bacterium]|nr:extracellular solute-binding protein [Chloroflexota bacterium]